MLEQLCPPPFQMDEELHHKQLLFIHALFTKLAELDAEKAAEGKLPKDDFRSAVAAAFPEASDETMAEMMRVVEQELDAKESETIEYKNLFLEVSALSCDLDAPRHRTTNSGYLYMT